MLLFSSCTCIATIVDDGAYQYVNCRVSSEREPSNSHHHIRGVPMSALVGPCGRMESTRRGLLLFVFRPTPLSGWGLFCLTLSICRSIPLHSGTKWKCLMEHFLV